MRMDPRALLCVSFRAHTWGVGTRGEQHDLFQRPLIAAQLLGTRAQPAPQRQEAVLSWEETPI